MIEDISRFFFFFFPPQSTLKSVYFLIFLPPALAAWEETELRANFSHVQVKNEKLLSFV